MRFGMEQMLSWRALRAQVSAIRRDSDCFPRANLVVQCR